VCLFDTLQGLINQMPEGTVFGIPAGQVREAFQAYYDKARSYHDALVAAKQVIEADSDPAKNRELAMSYLLELVSNDPNTPDFDSRWAQMSTAELHEELERLFWDTGNLDLRRRYHMELLGLPPDYGLGGKVFLDMMSFIALFFLSLNPVIRTATGVIMVLRGHYTTGLLMMLPWEYMFSKIGQVATGLREAAKKSRLVRIPARISQAMSLTDEVSGVVGSTADDIGAATVADTLDDIAQSLDDIADDVGERLRTVRRSDPNAGASLQNQRTWYASGNPYTPSTPKSTPLPSRHHVARSNGFVTDDITTVASDWNIIAQDVADINAGNAIRNGNDIIVNGRTYGLKGNGDIFPRFGPELVQLNRSQARILGMLNEGGEETARPFANALIQKQLGLTEAEYNQVLQLWTHATGN
jgi:hypothetical protein